MKILVSTREVIFLAALIYLVACLFAKELKKTRRDVDETFRK